MDIITNYYEELGLQKDKTIDEINDKINQLETVWNQRMLTDPEKANAIIAIISEAREVFSSEATKERYDKALNDKTSGDGSVDESQKNYEKWFKSAKNYLDAAEYELAKVSIEKASKYYDDEKEDVDYLLTAADVYRYNNETKKAIEYVNEAIAADPENCFGFIKRAEINLGCNEVWEAFESCKKAKAVAAQVGDKDGESYAWGLMAYAVFMIPDYTQAKIAADKAIELGDKSQLGAKVIEELSQSQRVPVSSLSQYRVEDCILTDEIIDLRSKLMSKYEGSSEPGWVLIELEEFEEYGPYSEYPDTVASLIEYYVLDINKGFMKLTGQNSTTRDWYQRGALTPSRYLEERYIATPEDDYNWADFLRPFDFIAYVVEEVKGIKRTSKCVGSVEYTNSDRFSLYRTGIKGAGLLNKLTEIYDNNIPPSYYNSEIAKDAENKRMEAEQKKMAEDWRSQGVCQHCGGSFTGLFGKKCSRCGKPKDY